MDCIKAILSRKSVRAFTGAAVEEADLELIVKCGMAAPSPHNLRSFYILTITNRDKLHALVPLCQWWKMLDSCGAAIIVCADTRKFGTCPDEFHLSGCHAVQENMLLASHSLGYGAVWLGVCRGSEFYDDYVKTLEIPDYLAVTGMMAVGIPEKEPVINDRFTPERWIREEFPAK